MSAFTTVDLSRLPALDLIESIDYEAIVARMIADLRARDPVFDALVESDPAFKQIEVDAYAEMLVRQRINEAARSVMLAYAKGTALDHIAAGHNVQRLLITPANPNVYPPVEAVYELDADLRRRVLLAWDGLSTAGPEGAYLFHALSAHPDVRDASAHSPTPGVVVVAIQSRSGNGVAPPALLAAVEAALSADSVRPLTDDVQVRAAEVVEYRIEAVLELWDGPDAALVIAAANANLDTLIDQQQRLGIEIAVSAHVAALHVPGVRKVRLVSPVQDIPMQSTQVGYCTGRDLTIGAA